MSPSHRMSGRGTLASPQLPDLVLQQPDRSLQHGRLTRVLRIHRLEALHQQRDLLRELDLRRRPRRDARAIQLVHGARPFVEGGTLGRCAVACAAERCAIRTPCGGARRARAQGCNASLSCFMARPVPNGDLAGETQKIDKSAALYKSVGQASPFRNARMLSSAVSVACVVRQPAHRRSASNCSRMQLVDAGRTIRDADLPFAQRTPGWWRGGSQTALRTHARGASPVHRRKARLKELCSANPSRRATSPMLSRRPDRRSFASL